MIAYRMTVIGFCALALAACKPTADEIANAKAALPRDCQIFDLGSYGSVTELIVVRCSHSTTSTSMVIPHSTGKTTSNYTYTAVEAEP